MFTTGFLAQQSEHLGSPTFMCPTRILEASVEAALAPEPHSRLEKL